MDTLGHFLARAARSFGPSPALRARHRYRMDVWSYDDLLERSGRVSYWLDTQGVGKGDRVVLWAPNSPWWVACFFGTLQIGAIVVPLDMRSGPDFVQRVLEQTEPALVLHSATAAQGLEISGTTAPIEELSSLPEAKARVAQPGISPRDIAEIMFTSGTTGDPKGVILTHDNILSDVAAVNQVLPSGPQYRLLSILPLSHMFEQTVGLLLPLLGGASVYYPATRQSTTLFRDIADQRITTMLLVPQALRLFMDAIEREVAREGREGQWRRLQQVAEHLPVPLRRLLFLRVHARLGGHLQFLVVGGAPLAPELAHTWEVLGIRVFEGYGATEAAPVIAATPPDHPKSGTVGKAVPGVEIRIAADHEIVVRGRNISPGYWRNPAATEGAFADGWYHTGDLGELNEAGYVSLHGRKKELIVLPDGQNVYAVDVEQALLRREKVQDAVVLGLPTPPGHEVHAALLLDKAGGDADSIVHEANAQLAPHQRIRSFTVWPEPDFPRTHTHKVKRQEVLDAVLRQREGTAESAPAPIAEPDEVSTLMRLVSRATDTPIPRLACDMTLENLGLDSLGRVELLAAIEAELGTYLDESRVGSGTTLEELQALLDRREDSARPAFPRWPLAGPARVVRRALQLPGLGLLQLMAPSRVSGAGILDDLSQPVLFVANHTSHFDSAVVLRALPTRWRGRLAVAAAADYFFRRRWLGATTALLLNAFPFSREGVVRPTLEHCAWLLDHGWSILLYPEGTRSTTGELGAFKPGVGLLAVELGAPVVPIYLAGVDRVLPKGRSIPRRGHVRVLLGSALRVESSTSYASATAMVEDAVRTLARADAGESR